MKRLDEMRDGDETRFLFFKPSHLIHNDDDRETPKPVSLEEGEVQI